MSAGPAAEGDGEVNLTPLLDVVLQLVMFFMLCANFVTEAVNESIKLPQAIAAKALDSKALDFVMLNVNDKGQVLLGKGAEAEVLDTPVKVTNYMKQQYVYDEARAKRLGRLKEFEQGKARSVVILRADKNCTYKHVHDVMEACRNATYTDIQLRTLQIAGK